MDARHDLVPDFGRYSSAIRRVLWLIIGLGVLAGVLVALWSTGRKDTLSAQFAVTKLEDDIVTDFGTVAPHLTVDAQAVELRSGQTRAKVTTANPSAVSVSITSNDMAGTITIRARGRHDDAVATVAAYEAELRALRRRAVDKAVSTAVNVGERYIADLSASIDQLGASEQGDGPPTVSDTVAVLERTELIKRRAEDSRTLEVLKSLPVAAETGVRRLEVRTPPDSTVPRAVFAAVGTSLLVAMLVSVVAFFDRRIRRAADVDRILGANSTLAAIERGVPDAQVGALVAALKHLAPDGGLIQLIGVAGYDSSTLAEALQTSGLMPDSLEVSSLPGVDVDSRAVQSAPRAVANVLVLRVGRADEKELGLAAFAIRRAGGKVGGAVLADSAWSASSVVA
jgi:hypothetical protein